MKKSPIREGYPIPRGQDSSILPELFETHHSLVLLPDGWTKPNKKEKFYRPPMIIVGEGFVFPEGIFVWDTTWNIMEGGYTSNFPCRWVPGKLSKKAKLQDKYKETLRWTGVGWTIGKGVIMDTISDEIDFLSKQYRDHYETVKDTPGQNRETAFKKAKDYLKMIGV